MPLLSAHWCLQIFKQLPIQSSRPHCYKDSRLCIRLSKWCASLDEYSLLEINSKKLFWQELVPNNFWFRLSDTQHYKHAFSSQWAQSKSWFQVSGKYYLILMIDLQDLWNNFLMQLLNVTFYNPLEILKIVNVIWTFLWSSFNIFSAFDQKKE